MSISYDCSQHFDTGGDVDSYSLQGAPAWLSIDNTGLMTGTADTEAVSNVTVTATNTDGDAVSNQFTVTATEAVSQSHKYWRLNITTATQRSFIYELEMRASVGGVDQCNGGAASALSWGASHPPDHAFDNNGSTYWEQASSAWPTWIKYTFVDPVEVGELMLNNYIAATVDLEIQWSDNDIDWNTVYSEADKVLSSSTVYYFEI